MDSPRRGDPPPGTGLTHIERRVLEEYPVLSVIAVVLVILSRVEAYGGDILGWNWLFISGALTFLVAFPLSLRLPGLVDDALRELRQRGVIPATEAGRAFESGLHAVANRHAIIGASICVGAVEVAWLTSGGFYPNWRFAVYEGIAGAVLDGCLAVPVGRFLGRTFAYGSLGRRLRMAGIALRPIPDHPDGRAGLTPVGSLYLGATMVVLLISAFLSIWVLLLPATRFWIWRESYVLLLIATLAWEVPTILRPLRQFHVMLVESKRTMLVEAETAGEHRRIAAMPTRVLGPAGYASLVMINLLLLAPVALFLVDITANR